MKKRKIAVITGTRAEYGILKPLLLKIKRSKKLELKLIVTGMHLLDKYGYTINEIKKDSFKIDAAVPIYSGDESDPKYHSRALSRGIESITDVLIKIKPDIVVVLGDRIEAFAGATASAFLNVPIAHIHGGDKTDSGHIDEPMRHAITRFAHIHFSASRGSSRRLEKMGEEKWRIFEVGALGLDSILDNKNIVSVEKMKEILHFNPLEEDFIVCIQHPVKIEREYAGQQMRETLEALKDIKIRTLIIYPNNDAGSEKMIEEIKKYKHLLFIHVFKNIDHLIYINLLRHAKLLIGNSSSGIIESPSFKLPVVNIGSRNVGREHAENVIFVRNNKKEIAAAIKKALYDEEFKEKVKNCNNPYGNGTASDKIVKILSEIKLDKKLLQKKITY